MEWQSMDTAPRDGRNILAEFAGGGAVVVCWRQLSTMFSSNHIQDYKADDCAWVTGMGHRCDNLALWMPEPSSKDRSHWQPISTAPQGSGKWDHPEVELGFEDGGTARGRWNPDSYLKNPKPFWEWNYYSKTSSRARQPVIWRPLPTKEEIRQEIHRIKSSLE